ncbi:uncharacterized protein LOC62_01G000256 [Vanrija pseudolonga]|uniref:Uncharacterized protein n=1 Tax=Vanrija pseudolonga TaxID=143232 RepID=A0AAF0Y2B8_9TREE|nr:hypothetical protein LOC62_01G000256 [Vanrija pseudolonga]WOO76629.1 hypothetical protein LOC62_01G000256 [Vanrija pseudolonga]
MRTVLILRLRPHGLAAGSKRAVQALSRTMGTLFGTHAARIDEEGVLHVSAALSSVDGVILDATEMDKAPLPALVVTAAIDDTNAPVHVATDTDNTSMPAICLLDNPLAIFERDAPLANDIDVVATLFLGRPIPTPTSLGHSLNLMANESPEPALLMEGDSEPESPVGPASPEADDLMGSPVLEQLWTSLDGDNTADDTDAGFVSTADNASDSPTMSYASLASHAGEPDVVYETIAAPTVTHENEVVDAVPEGDVIHDSPRGSPVSTIVFSSDDEDEVDDGSFYDLSPQPVGFGFSNDDVSALVDSPAPASTTIASHDDENIAPNLGHLANFDDFFEQVPLSQTGRFALATYLASAIVTRLACPAPARVGQAGSSEEEWGVTAVLNRAQHRASGLYDFQPEFVLSRSPSPVPAVAVSDKLASPSLTDPYGIVSAHSYSRGKLVASPSFIDFVVTLINAKSLSAEVVIAAAWFLETIPLHAIDNHKGVDLRQRLEAARYEGQMFAVERRIAMLVLLIADMSVSDDTAHTSAWAEVSSVPKVEAVQMERDLLAHLFFSVSIPLESWRDHCSQFYSGLARNNKFDDQVTWDLLDVGHKLVVKATAALQNIDKSVSAFETHHTLLTTLPPIQMLYAERAEFAPPSQLGEWFTAANTYGQVAQPGFLDASYYCNSQPADTFYDNDDEEFVEYDGAAPFPAPFPAFQPFNEHQEQPVPMMAYDYPPGFVPHPMAPEYFEPAQQHQQQALFDDYDYGYGYDNFTAPIGQDDGMVDDDASWMEPYDGAVRFPAYTTQAVNVHTTSSTPVTQAIEHQVVNVPVPVSQPLPAPQPTSQPFYDNDSEWDAAPYDGAVAFPIPILAEEEAAEGAYLSDEERESIQAWLAHLPRVPSRKRGVASTATATFPFQQSFSSDWTSDVAMPNEAGFIEDAAYADVWSDPDNFDDEDPDSPDTQCGVLLVGRQQANDYVDNASFLYGALVHPVEGSSSGQTRTSERISDLFKGDGDATNNLYTLSHNRMRSRTCGAANVGLSTAFDRLATTPNFLSSSAGLGPVQTAPRFMAL